MFPASYHSINTSGRDIVLLLNISHGMSLLYHTVLVVNIMQGVKGEMTGEVIRTFACVCVCVCYLYVEGRSV